MDTLLSPRRRTLLQALAAGTLVAACGERRGVAIAPQLEFRGPTMGTTFTAKIAGPRLPESAAAAARDGVAGALDAVVARMSTYLPHSELSRFNRHSDASPFALSADTLAVFALAREVSALSDGAFDITIAPLVDAWGFGPVKAHRVVGDAEIAALAPRVGWRGLAVDTAAGTVAKAHAGQSADLSGIAKGFAVDQAARALDALGIADYMVEAGGEVRTRGLNPEGRPWQIAIERPDAMPPRPHVVVPLSGLAMATSGDYRIFFEEGGRRYSHEIDPATGRPVRHGLASVSVVAPDCGYADAMATALIVLGPDRGYALAAARNIAAHFIVRRPTARSTIGRRPRLPRSAARRYATDRGSRGRRVALARVPAGARRVRRRVRRDGCRSDAVGTLPARLLRGSRRDGAARRAPVVRDVPEPPPAPRALAAEPGSRGPAQRGCDRGESTLAADSSTVGFLESVAEAARAQCSRWRALRAASGTASRRVPVPRVFVALRRSCQKR